MLKVVPILLLYMLGVMTWPQTGVIHYHTHSQLGLPEKVMQSKVVYLLCTLVRIYERDGSYDLRKVRWSGLLLLSEWLSSTSTA